MDARLIIRMRKADLLLIKTKVPPRMISSVVREVLLQHPPRRQCQQATKERGELCRQIAWVGNNLNQLARTLHTCKLKGSPLDLVQISLQLQKIQEQIYGRASNLS